MRIPVIENESLPAHTAAERPRGPGGPFPASKRLGNEGPAMTHTAPSKLTIRARLTLVFGVLLVLAGVLLLGLTYALVTQQLDPGGPSTQISGTGGPDGAATTFNPPERAVDQAVGDAQRDVLGSVITQGGIALAAVGAVAIGGGWLIAGRLLQPLSRITETARRIAEAPVADRGLHERIDLQGPNDELKQLADIFDVMLTRLDHAFDGQRRFIANASHELRTPLSLNRALIEVAVREGGASPEVRQLGGTLLEINGRHERLIDGLLLLARSEREVAENSFVDLADIVDHVATQTPAGNITVLAEPGEAPTTGNPVLLERLVQNLVDNGIRHNVSEDGWVRITSGTGPDGRVVLEVANTGPVVAPYDIPSIFEPFRRLSADRLFTSPGAGLGLSIVRAVAHAHGGDVRAEPRDGGGLVVTVHLKAAP